MVKIWWANSKDSLRYYSNITLYGKGRPRLSFYRGVYRLPCQTNVFCVSPPILFSSHSNFHRLGSLLGPSMVKIWWPNSQDWKNGLRVPESKFTRERAIFSVPPPILLSSRSNLHKLGEPVGSVHG